MELEFGSGVNVFVSCSYWIRIVFVLSLPEPAMVITHHDYLFSGGSETHVNMSMHVNTSTHINPCQYTPTHVNTRQHTSTPHKHLRNGCENHTIVSCYIMLYYVISCYIMLYHVTSPDLWRGTVMFFNSLAKVIVTISLANRKLRQCDNIMTASRMCGQGSREKGSRFLVIALLKTFPDTHERSMNDLASRSSSCHHESSEVNVLLADLVLKQCNCTLLWIPTK